MFTHPKGVPYPFDRLHPNRTDSEPRGDNPRPLSSAELSQMIDPYIVLIQHAYLKLAENRDHAPTEPSVWASPSATSVCCSLGDAKTSTANFSKPQPAELNHPTPTCTQASSN